MHAVARAFAATAFAAGFAVPSVHAQSGAPVVFSADSQGIQWGP